ncbi:hypothetical protein E3V39_06895 [Gammaproteobacteria bacterium LSUCC0112]|nr:hypothetical protein E3V39_06895 [Gammaproteobacteria bacterium LSUCC0112]
MSLRFKIKEMMDAFDNRSIAEKALLSLAAVGLPVWLFATFFLSPLTAESDGLRRQVAAAQAQLQAMEQREELAISSSAEDPNQAVRLRIERAIADQSELQDEIEQLAGNLVTPQSMTRLLTSMLENQSGLNLVKVENRVPQAMRNEPAVEQDDETAGQAVISSRDQEVYKHSLVIELEGDYLSLIGYLKRIENFSERFFWDSLSFVQQNWPTARITLELHTLSTEEGFVGV